MNFDYLDESALCRLSKAIRAAHLQTVESLIASGASVNSADNRGWQPIHWAMKLRGRALPFVKALTDLGAYRLPLFILSFLMMLTSIVHNKKRVSLARKMRST
jgi:hypothetical protein